MPLINIFPENISTYGQDIDNVFWLVLGIVSFSFIVCISVLFYALYRFHHKRSDRATIREKHAWTTVGDVGMLLGDIVIIIYGFNTWVDTQITIVPKADYHVAVTARMWNFIFTYPGKDGILYTKDDITIDEQNSELHVPVNKNIIVDLRAKDVVHSFFVPNLRLKQDAIPGRKIVRWFNATKEGKYDIVCAEICGVLHSQMRNFLIVESEEKYSHYINSLEEKNAPQLTMNSNK